ncbi:MAG: hypothetical protein IPI68_10705 [Chitinophagaceae bacterium]|nr:hypothetical protein [Chitinophagaceae bacterium]MBK9569688.1 hypothetical protein [Chitinophagaceae bacterium]
MSLHLHSNAPLFEIQSGFSKKFPGLKLDFIFEGDEKLNLSAHHKYSFANTPVEELTQPGITKDIIIDELMTTKEVEELFEMNWHLPAKVYVEIGGYWQKNRKTECRSLQECMVSHADF